MSASEFVGFIYIKIGRPFKPTKHLPPSSVQTHLGLQNMLHNFESNQISLVPKDGKLQDIYDNLAESEIAIPNKLLSARSWCSEENSFSC